MPVSVNAALRESLSDPGHQHHHHHPHQLLQSQIASATKHLVLKTIEYEEYPENFLSQNDALKSKYILLSANHPEKGANGNSLVAKKLSNGSTSLNGSNGLGMYARWVSTLTSFGDGTKVRLCEQLMYFHNFLPHFLGPTAHGFGAKFAPIKIAQVGIV